MSKPKRWAIPKTKRNRLAIMRWLLDQEPTLTVTGIAATLKIAHPRVSNTLADRLNDHKVLTYLYNMGCPAKFLALPPGLEASLKNDNKKAA